MWRDDIHPIKATGPVVGEYGLVSSFGFLAPFCGISTPDVPFKGFQWLIRLYLYKNINWGPQCMIWSGNSTLLELARHNQRRHSYLYIRKKLFTIIFESRNFSLGTFAGVLHRNCWCVDQDPNYCLSTWVIQCKSLQNCWERSYDGYETKPESAELESLDFPSLVGFAGFFCKCMCMWWPWRLVQVPSEQVGHRVETDLALWQALFVPGLSDKMQDAQGHLHFK